MQFKSSVLMVLSSIMVCSMALANSELDGEINSLQVQLVQQNKSTVKARPVAKKQVAKKKTKPVVVVRSKTTKPIRKTIARVTTPKTTAAPMAAPIAPPSLPQDNYYSNYQEQTAAPATAPRESQLPETTTNSTHFKQVEDLDDTSNNVFERISLVPAASISTFDGGGTSQVIPSGVSNPINVAPATALLTDINVLGTEHLVLETGANFIQTGAQTGFAYQSWLPNYSYNEKVTLSYIGVPINAKWLARGEHKSSLYVKLGVDPIFLMNHQYQSYSGYNEEFRFGGYGNMDALITGGIGYTFQLGRHYQLSLDISGYQGVIPVLSTYNVYNVGGTAGIGLAYIL